MLCRVARLRTRGPGTVSSGVPDVLLFLDVLGEGAQCLEKIVSMWQSGVVDSIARFRPCAPRAGGFLVCWTWLLVLPLNATRWHY